MKKYQGSTVTNIILPAIDGAIFDLHSIKGKPFMLSFFRFASCPFCNLRLHQLVKRFDEFGDDFTIVAIFDSPLNNLVQHAKDHHAPFIILADEDNQYYREYGIEYSILGVIKGMTFRLPTLLKGLLKGIGKGLVKGYNPLRFKGRITTMPADLLVDKDGIVVKAYYGKDEGDHLAFEDVKAFSLR
ncbi:MAG: redoxin domain-containing protein [Colwellia sp.]|nr:redoxin domain-containing protein [Colwellia sp.]